MVFAITVIVLLGAGALFNAVMSLGTPPQPGSEPLVWSKPIAVVRVVDGDTVVVATEVGEETVRLIGVDTPETVRPNTPVECFGPEASDHTHQLLDGQQVLLAADPSQEDRDRYGRLLRYVQTVSGVDVGADLITGGFAREYTFQRSAYAQQASFRALELDARQNGRGLWASC
ncbi:thermonuclease family protein [Plantibacter sp. CFBP 8775]|uniref:thermonuclease family protein n=1 Tax=Plantibacter sp. CFBP 8775 TaxID=2774038 RepID=UPI001784C81F|nr:thermonuclease family protein [Plantibacter sp. CFBP 8775]MBD8104771.1 thermonuclease family protein [Plantibacter sp. CFBP 8775]